MTVNDDIYRERADRRDRVRLFAETVGLCVLVVVTWLTYRQLGDLEDHVAIARIAEQPWIRAEARISGKFRHKGGHWSGLGIELPITVALKNFGHSPALGVALEVWLDGSHKARELCLGKNSTDPAGRTDLTIFPGEERSIDISALSNRAVSQYPVLLSGCVSYWFGIGHRTGFRFVVDDPKTSSTTPGSLPWADLAEGGWNPERWPLDRLILRPALQGNYAY